MFSSEQANGIRVRLSFEEGIDRENAWFFIDFTNIACIRRLRKKVCDRFDLKREDINFYLQEYLLTPDETIHVLQENDCVSVRLKSKDDLNTEGNESLNQNSNLSVPKRRRALEDDDDSRLTMPPSVTEPLKKRRCRNKDKQKKHSSSEACFIIPTVEGKEKKSSRMGKKYEKPSQVSNTKQNKLNKHIRFDEEQICDSSQQTENNSESEKKSSKTEDVDDATEHYDDKETAKDVLAKCYDQFTPLIGPPRIGDILAFKEIVLSESYCPEVSDYQEGKVTSVNGTSVTLFIKNRPVQPQRVNGKFELNWEEMNGDEPEMNFSQELTIPLTSLLHPKLVNLDL